MSSCTWYFTTCLNRTRTFSKLGWVEQWAVFGNLGTDFLLPFALQNMCLFPFRPDTQFGSPHYSSHSLQSQSQAAELVTGCRASHSLQSQSHPAEPVTACWASHSFQSQSQPSEPVTACRASHSFQSQS